MIGRHASVGKVPLSTGSAQVSGCDDRREVAHRVDLYFSQYFDVAPGTLDAFGAFDISVVSDLPLFIDPFLLFNSEKPEYQALHDGVIEYLIFLRDHATEDLDPGLIANWYRFKEVKQNWLGFTLLGNGGHALGAHFAEALHASLGSILSDFGQESVTQGSHLEKLCLIKGGVGRDSISDFTTNLIKDYLLQFTQDFARNHLDPERCRQFAVQRARFNYTTKTWETRNYYLPALDHDFVILTPVDILTRDDTWISHADMVAKFAVLPDAVPNDQLRAQINQYFRSRLGRRPSERDRRAAAADTLAHFPELVDFYIRLKEQDGDRAQSISSQRVEDARRVLVEQLKRALADLEARTDFYDTAWTSYDEALSRARLFKDYVENQDGYKLINRAGKPFSQEAEVQLFFGLLWCKSDFDANREVNNGRGPVDFKISFGAGDKSLIEFKLASNTSLKRNLQKQIAIYEAANATRKSVKVIMCYTAKDQLRVARVLKELKLDKEPSIVVIDARSDNKPSGSKA